MKVITIFLLFLIYLQSASAAQNCDDYINDEWSASRYQIETISGDNVVTDSITGLMWKQCSEGLSGADCMTGIASTHTWKNALDLPVALNSNLGFAGYSDWRLPNIKEINSITAVNCVDPAINETVFPNTASSSFWTSSPLVFSEFEAWSFDFYFGSTSRDDRINNFRVLLVRSGH